MAPNKFEKHIKKELQEREIQPSVNAWNSLSERLDAQSQKPKRNGYFWYGIAASIIGLLIISVVYFNSVDSINSSDNQMVDTDEKSIGPETNSRITNDSEIEEVVVENNTVEQASDIKVKTIVENQNSELQEQITSVNQVDKVVQSSNDKILKSNNFEEEIISTKILEIVAVVDSLEQNSNALSDAEVDDLLRNAQEEILQDKLFNNNGSVDAMALLTEVEDELDKSFRDQIFESLKTGFLKVRTAVADRNK